MDHPRQRPHDQADSTPDQAGQAIVRPRARSWLCPGAGFAACGRGKLATVTLLSSLALLIGGFWLCLQPGPLSFTVVAGVMLLALILWLGEQLTSPPQVAAPAGKHILIERFVLISIALGVLGVALIITARLHFEVLTMGSSGMSPTLKKGEKIIAHMSVDPENLNRETIIVFLNAEDSEWGDPGITIVSRILAVPGDKLSINGDRYQVNDRLGPIASEALLKRLAVRVPQFPDTALVPDNHYFVVQDSTVSYDSRVLSWVPFENIDSTTLWRLSSRERLFESVE